MNEVWKSLKGLVNSGENYSVSSLGRVRNDKYGRIKKLSVHKSGYYTTNIGKVSGIYVQRLVALAFINNPDPVNKIQVNHIDGDKKNNHINNLEWVTPSENIIHANATGLQPHTKGKDHHMTKLTEDDVVTIKEMLRDGVKGAEIGRKYGVTKYVISCIKTGRSWRHVHVEGFTPTYKKDPRRIS